MSNTLSMSFDLKEDLRLRMMDLEKKLAESEEERSKMEKTCNALMRSFQEEERMRFIALNKKYEKFLQDCRVRKRRNEIILRSLRRIEDRSKALFAKTETLKLLKDRQISYLKVKEDKKDEVCSRVSLTQKTVDDTTPKSVHWKTPLAADEKKGNLENVEDLLCSRISDAVPGVMTSTSPERCKQQRWSEALQRYEGRKNSEGVIYNETFHNDNDVVEKKSSLVKTGSDFSESLAKAQSVHVKSEKLFRGNDERKPESRKVSKYGSAGDKFNDKTLLETSGDVASHEGSIEDVLSSKEKCSDGKKLSSHDGKVLGKDDIGPSEQNNSQDESLPRINHRFVPFRSTDVARDEEKHKNMSENATPAHHQNEDTSKTLPMGLDGIDYQNETYPESYYEQPVYHHSHTNIAADVILEEDETEQDGEEEEEKEKKDITTDYDFGEDSHGSSPRVHSSPSGNRIHHNESDSESTKDKDDDIDEPYGQIKSQKSESVKGSEAEPSDLGIDERKKNGSLVSNTFDKCKPPVKSTLLHLLESDSESYQIEHGNGVSDNEVSDFDVSFQ